MGTTFRHAGLDHDYGYRCGKPATYFAPKVRFGSGTIDLPWPFCHGRATPAVASKAEISCAFLSQRLRVLRPLERQPPDHRLVAEAGADAVDGVLGDCGAAVDQVSAGKNSAGLSLVDIEAVSA